MALLEHETIFEGEVYCIHLFILISKFSWLTKLEIILFVKFQIKIDAILHHATSWVACYYGAEGSVCDGSCLHFS